MVYSFAPTQFGTVERRNNGVLEATGTPDSMKAYGFQTTTPPVTALEQQQQSKTPINIGAVNANPQIQQKEPTVLTSANKTEKTNPENVATLASYPMSGSQAGQDGFVRNADASFAEAPSGAMQDESGVWTSGGLNYAVGPLGGKISSDPYANQIFDQLGELKTRMDATGAATIENIKQQYEGLIADTKQANAGQEAGLNTLLIRGGSQHTASGEGFMNAEVNYGIRTIGNLYSKEQEAILVAQSAMENNDFQLLDKQLSIAKTAREERQTAAKELNDKIIAAREAQQKATYDQVTKPIQDLVTDVMKNTGNSALAEQVGRAKSVSEALSLAGSSLQTSSNPDIQSWIFAKQKAEADGTVPPSQETFQAALDKKKLDSEISKLRTTEGIKFNYAIALEKAKNALANAPNPDYHGEFAATVKLAAQAGSTNAQRTQIKNDLESFISEGDYNSAYTQVLSSASMKLTGANASNFQQQVQSYGALKDMRDVLKEFEAAGGNTNIFKGGEDAIQTRIGVLMTDPKYAAIAVRLSSAFQQYRQNMTGAAFGAKESSEYASVVPSKNNTFALNMAKIDGAESYLNSVVENTVKQTVGQGGVYIKQYAEAGQNAQNAQQEFSTKVQELYSQHQSEIDELIQARPDITNEEILQVLGYQ